MAKKKPRKIDMCPICGQFMDIYCRGHKEIPFVDGNKYDKICFTCFYVPKTIKQIYDKSGYLIEEKELPYGPKHLHTAQELFDGNIAESMPSARRCVAGVRNAIKASKLKRGFKFKKPKDPDTKLNDYC